MKTQLGNIYRNQPLNGRQQLFSLLNTSNLAPGHREISMLRSSQLGVCSAAYKRASTKILD